MKMEELVNHLENTVLRKKESDQTQAVDFDVIAWISVYRHGSPKFKDYAKEWLVTLAVNAGILNKKRDIKD